MALFSKCLRCFYCGQCPTQPVRGPVRKFHCDACEADNYLDQNGEITDPPAADTNPDVYGPRASSPPFESVEFRESDLFCAQCARNQHLFTTSLASYFPPSDDPTYHEYERDYAQFRKSLEDRYPQVCDRCEPRVRQRIRQAGYEAKADHLRRMMDQSRASKAARRTRNRSWQSLLVYAGALGHWASVGGQLAWDVLSALTSPSSLDNVGISPKEPPSLGFCFSQTVQMRRIPGDCSFDLAPFAGFALIAGSLSIWWNPKLRMKVEGRGGRFAGLGEYYKVQLIALVARCVFWALLKDPSASGFEPTLPPALHMFMIMFTVLSIVISRRVVQYDTRPLVNWADNSWEKKPIRSTATSPVSADRDQRASTTPNANHGPFSQRFPLEKLTSALPAVERSPVIPPTPPPEADDMDWTPSAPQNIRPTVSVYQRNKPSVLDGPNPFYGNIPAAPQPPAWNLRTRTATKPNNQVVARNPFHRSPSQPPNQWQQKSTNPEAVFQAPKFFPKSDYDNSTGLETLFDRAFNMDPKDARKRDWDQSAPSQKSLPASARNYLVFQYLRLGLLLGTLAAWTFSQNHQLSFRGNYIEIGALGSASLIAGFALLEAVKGPLVHWNGMEILVYITEIGAAIHLGAHLPRASYNREYFDRYGKVLLMFMAVQEFLGLLAFYRAMFTPAAPQTQQPTRPVSPQQESPHRGAIAWSPTESTVSSPGAPSFASQSPAPPLSFSSTAGASSFSSALPPAPHYRLSSSHTFSSFPTATHNKNPHSFTMSSLKASEPPSDYEQDSDNETVATTATALTDATNHHIRYARSSNLDFNSPFSPRRSELGPGIGGLSLEDRPASRRMTRSQTQQGLTGRRHPGRAIR